MFTHLICAFRSNYEKISKKKDEFEQMKKNAESKYEEIQSGMQETNKRRKQIKGQLEKKIHDLEELKRVSWPPPNLHLPRISDSR